MLFWVWRMNKRKMFKRIRPAQRRITSIRGNELQAYLSEDTPLHCLIDDGVRFGDSFQLKTSPALNHNPCLCKAAPIEYSSGEVFNGALRNLTGRESALGLLSPDEADCFKNMLIALYSLDKALSFEQFISNHNMELVRKELHSPMITLLHKKHRQLQLHLSPPTEIHDEDAQKNLSQDT